MSDVGGLLYDKDAVYISMDDRSVNFSKRGDSGAPGAGSGVAEEGAIAGAGVGVGMVHGLQDTRVALDEKLAASEIQLFRGRGTLKGDYEDSAREEDSEDEDALDLDEDALDEDDEVSDDDGAEDAGVRGRRAAEAASGRTRRAAVFSSDGASGGATGV